MNIRTYKSFFLPIFVILSAAVLFFCSAEPSGADAEPQGLKKTKGEEIAAFAVSISGGYSTEDRTGPESFDCSGFVYYVMNHFGADVPQGNTQTQLLWGKPVDFEALKDHNDVTGLKPGDLIFFDYEPDGAPNHVGLYIGDGKIRHCWNGGVCTTPLSGNFYKGDDRPLYSAVLSVRRASVS